MTPWIKRVRVMGIVPRNYIGLLDYFLYSTKFLNQISKKYAVTPYQF